MSVIEHCWEQRATVLKPRRLQCQRWLRARWEMKVWAWVGWNLSGGHWERRPVLAVLFFRALSLHTKHSNFKMLRSEGNSCMIRDAFNFQRSPLQRSWVDTNRTRLQLSEIIAQSCIRLCLCKQVSKSSGCISVAQYEDNPHRNSWFLSCDSSRNTDSSRGWAHVGDIQLVNEHRTRRSRLFVVLRKNQSIVAHCCSFAEELFKHM